MQTFRLLLLDVFCDGEIPSAGYPDSFMPSSPSPLHSAVKKHVYDADVVLLRLGEPSQAVGHRKTTTPDINESLANLMLGNVKLVDAGPDARPEWSEVKQHPYFEDIDWDRVAARGYDLHYRPCDRASPKHCPLVPTDRWIVEDSRGWPLTDRNTLDGLQILLDRTAELKIGLSAAEYDFFTGVPLHDRLMVPPACLYLDLVGAIRVEAVALQLHFGGFAGDFVGHQRSRDIWHLTSTSLVRVVVITKSQVSP
ncbi:hypothetical protein BU15DRAFT_78796 [Melanogaster broomeanus]|nr:hypothetical protein BU15DRAFT_78796 [Melanogaster broomeanus]